MSTQWDGKSCANCFFSIRYNAKEDLYLCDLQGCIVSGNLFCGCWDDPDDWKKVPENEDTESGNRPNI